MSSKRMRCSKSYSVYDRGQATIVNTETLNILYDPGAESAIWNVADVGFIAFDSMPTTSKWFRVYCF